MTENPPVNGHPGPEEIAAYLSDGLSVEERDVINTHLSRCRVCRRQVTSAHAMLGSRPRPIRWIAAAAAVLAIAMLGQWSFGSARRSFGSPDIERASGLTSNETAIVALTPAEGDTIAATATVFAWRSRGPDLLYRLSLTDGRGQALWTTDTPDTSAVLPPNVRLMPGARYFWYVDALGVDAQSWTTGTRAFVVAP